jgi:hypothetical protein
MTLHDIITAHLSYRIVGRGLFAIVCSSAGRITLVESLAIARELKHANCGYRCNRYDSPHEGLVLTAPQPVVKPKFRIQTYRRLKGEKEMATQSEILKPLVDSAAVTKDAVPQSILRQPIFSVTSETTDADLKKMADGICYQAGIGINAFVRASLESFRRVARLEKELDALRNAAVLPHQRKVEKR